MDTNQKFAVYVKMTLTQAKKAKELGIIECDNLDEYFGQLLLLVLLRWGSVFIVIFLAVNADTDLFGPYRLFCFSAVDANSISKFYNPIKIRNLIDRGLISDDKCVVIPNIPSLNRQLAAASYNPFGMFSIWNWFQNDKAKFCNGSGLMNNCLADWNWFILFFIDSDENASVGIHDAKLAWIVNVVV